MLTKPTKIVELRKYFDKLLNNSNINGKIVKYKRLIYQTAEPRLTEPELETIQLIIKNLKNFKGPGVDEINPKLFKLAGKDFLTDIYFLVKDIWNNVCLRFEI